VIVWITRTFQEYYLCKCRLGVNESEGPGLEHGANNHALDSLNAKY
jgi:hypothetical protein